jgi:hypothetical protein
LLAASAFSACSTPVHCESPGKCGGDFLANKSDLGSGDLSQEWVGVSTDACTDNVPNPPDPPQLALIPPRPAGVRAVEPSTVDWCAGLTLGVDGNIKLFDDGWYETLKKYNGWFPSIPMYSANLEFVQNNQYTLKTVQLAKQHFELPNSCLSAQGVLFAADHATNCLLLGQKLQAFVVKRLDSLKFLEATVYTSQDPADPSKDLPVCLATTGGDTEYGCVCDYNVAISTTTAGPWASDPSRPGKITFYDASAAPPVDVDYCMSGGELQLSGTKGVDLFNRNSMKTLTLRAPSCSDGVQSKTLGEEGIDCGGKCPNPCTK